MGDLPRWAGVAVAMLLQIGLWLLIWHLVAFGGSSSSGGSSSGGSGPGYDIGVAIGICIMLTAVLGPTAAVSLLAPRQPFLIGCLTASVPILLAASERQWFGAKHFDPALMAVAYVFSAVSVLFAVIPPVLIRRRLESVRRRAEQLSIDPYLNRAAGSGPPVEGVWPPPPAP